MKKVSLKGLDKGLLMLALVLTLLQPAFAFGAEDAPQRAGQIHPYDLHTEYSHNPLGIDNSKPRLSWLLESAERAQVQTAYHVLVASDAGRLAANEGDMWDSGKIVSEDSNNVVYEGLPLQSGTRYYFKVRSWDKNDEPSAWSEPGWWEMGLLNPTDWQAEWVAVPTADKVSNYSIELDFTILKDGAAIMFGGPNASSNFFWQFNVKDKPYAQFRPHTNVGGTRVIKEVDISHAIPNDRQLNVSYHLKIEVKGSEVKTYIDDQLIDQMQNANLSYGPIGFRQFKDTRTDERALFDNIVVKDDSGKILFQADFEEPGTASFDGGTVTEDGKLLVENATIYQRADRSSPLLRKSFEISKPVRKATAYATALGLYELSLNGTRVGDDYFNPGWTDYNKRLQYQTYDVTDMLLQGDNAVGAVLGDGWYAGNVAHVGPQQYGSELSLLFQLQIEYEDGTKERIATDSSWRSTVSGPILSSDILMGELYDARKEIADWNRNGFDDSAWSGVKTVKPAAGKLVAQLGPTVKATEELKPIAVTQPSPGTYIFDMGQNMVGWARLKVEGPAGSKVKMRFGEMLQDDGTLYTENLRTALQTDEYILKGGGPEQYEPNFTFHGFRYVEITGYPNKPALDSITGIVVHTDTPQAGTFETSNPMVNQLYSNITWGQRGNFLSVPTDCPQRNERMGWTGDSQVFVRTATYNMEVPGFYEKYMRDVVDAQGSNGAFPDVAPNVKGMGNGSNGWGDAGVIIPWTLYLAYNDTAVIREHYDAMVKWIEYLKANSNGLVRPAGGYGDWLSVNETTPTDVVNTAYFAYSTNLLSRMANIIGKTADAEKYGRLFQDIKAAFNAAFVGADGRIKGNTQSAYVFALQMDLLDGDNKQKAAQYLVENIKEKDWHLSTGFLGVGYLLPVLTEAGYPEVAYRLLTNDTYPSWGYSIKNGATTIWERWNSYTLENGFGDAGMNSFNHYSLGSVGEWMFRYAAGIEADPDQPGFKHILIQPTPGGDFSHVNGEYRSIYGLIKSYWERQGADFKLNITIPVNTTATVYIPAADASSVREGGQSAGLAEGVEFLRMEGDRAVYSVGSGTYSFSSRMADDAAELESISLSGSATKLQIGDSVSLTLTGSLNNGMKADFTNAEIRYESSDRAVLRVDGDGKATAVGPGVAKVTATVKLGAKELASSVAFIVVTGPNLALGKPVTARESLESGSEWGKANLTDGTLNRKYSSTGSQTQSQENNPLWVEIDLGTNQNFNSIVLFPRTDSRTIDSRTASYPIDFTIQVKPEGGSYSEVKQLIGEPNPMMLPQLYSFDNQTARYVRLSVSKLGEMPSDDIYYRLQLAELEVYNNIAAAQRDMATLSGSASVVQGQEAEFAIGVGGLDTSSGFTALDVVFRYDPQSLEFDTVAENHYLSLAPSAIQSLHPNLAVVGSLVKPAIGEIRILIASMGEQNGITNDGNLFSLRGKAKAEAPTGHTDVSLTSFTVSSKDGVETGMDVSEASWTVEIAPSTPVDRTALDAAVAAAQAKHDRAVEGTKLGQYAPGSKSILQAAIQTAQNTGGSQSQIDDAVVALNDAVELFLTKIVTLTEGRTKVSIGDLAIIAKYYGVKSTDANWSEIEKADILGINEIDIRILAAVARMILDNGRE